MCFADSARRSSVRPQATGFPFVNGHFFVGRGEACDSSEMTSASRLNEIIILIHLNSYMMLSETVNPYIM